MNKQELLATLEEKGNVIVNRNKITIRQHEDGTMTAKLMLIDDKEEMLSMEVFAEYENAAEFIEATSLQQISQLDLIDRSALWWQYLKGKGGVYLVKEEQADWIQMAEERRYKFG